MKRPFHPYLLGLYPILFILSYNLTLVRSGEVVIPLAITMAVVVAAMLIGRRLGGRPQLVAFCTSIAIAWFFAYGHIALLVGPRLKGLLSNPNLVLLPLWTAIAVVAVVFVRRVRAGSIATVILNTTSLVLVLTTSMTIAIGLMRDTTPVAQASAILGPPIKLDAKADKPNVYYLVFDRYAADETLRVHHRFDNTPFLDALVERGFVVPETAYANYPTTTTSLASSLNMEYLDPISQVVGLDYQLQIPFHEAIKRSRLVRALKDDGYRYVHIGSWWEPTRTSRFADRRVQTLPVSEFGRALFTTTAVAPFAREILGTADLPELHRRVATRQFDAIGDVASGAGPKFVFAHFLMPHPPYVFDRGGAAVTEQPETIAERMAAYVEQLRFTNEEITAALDRILSVDPDPVIVIQADEGPNPTYWSKNHPDWPNAKDNELATKYQILTAFRFPGVDPSEIADVVTPVNTFRFVLSAYLGADLEPLENQLYGSRKGAPYRFEDMTARVMEAVKNDLD